jgi:tungstate transport system ATP-binding protein
VSAGREPVLVLAGVRVARGGATVLDVPAFEARAGEVVAIIGPNGAGKSTLLRVAALLEPPDTGTVTFRGRPTHAARALAERRQMATVFQTPLLADTTVAANAALGLHFRGVPAGDAARRVARALERLGVGHLPGRNARTLSGGEAQRVALARALVLEPALLLLDEPFAALDPPTRDGLVTDLGAILRRDRVTTLLVTHERAEAQALADRVGVLMGGRLRQLDDTARVFQSPASEEIARFVGVETIVTGRVIATHAGVTVVEVAGRKLEAAGPAAAGESVRLCIRPEDVTLGPAGETGQLSSARNRLEGRIVAITPSLAYLRVLVDCGFPLAAAVTRRSAEDLALAEGVAVTAVFKASAAHLIPLGPSVALGPSVVLDTPAEPAL